MRRPTAGMALPLVLLLLVALTAFGHSALVLSQREVRASAAYRDMVRAEKAAGVGLRLALSLPLDPFGDRPPWVPELLLKGELMDGLTYSATRHWIDREFFVLQGKGGVKGWPGEKEVGWVGWTLYPGARVSSFLAVSEVGGEVRAQESSTHSAERFFSAPEAWPYGVGEELRSRAQAIFLAGPLPGVLKRAAASDSTGIPGLGLLTGAELLRRSQHSWPEGLPKMDGGGTGCPGSGERPAFLGSVGSLSLPPGRTCGLVFTGGDLRVGTGSVFQGLALVGGNLVVEVNGRFEGMARVGNDLVLETGAIFLGASVPVLWALEGIGPLHLPISVPSDPF